MRREEFAAWVEREGKAPATVRAQADRVARVERLYGDIEKQFALDRLQGLLAEFQYTSQDERDGRPDPTRLGIFSDGKLRENLSDYRVSIKKYRKFLEALHQQPLSLRDEEADMPEEGRSYVPVPTDRRHFELTLIAKRRGQRPFRDSLLQRYHRRCLITGCTIAAILEAAHICPYRGEEDHHVTNGLLLRTDIHTLFDLNMIGIRPDDLTVVLSPSIAADNCYTDYGGRRLGCPSRRGPSVDALAQRFEDFQRVLKQKCPPK